MRYSPVPSPLREGGIEATARFEEVVSKRNPCFPPDLALDDFKPPQCNAAPCNSRLQQRH